MAQDRRRNRNAGHSVKLSSLTDLEFRVWDQYELSADDFGLMRMSSLTIQDDNVALASRPRKAIDAALERLVAVGLLLKYQHQGRAYVCDPVWQKYHKIDYPTQTLHPQPPEDILRQCHVQTQELFRQCFGKKSVRFKNPTKTFPETSGKSHEDSGEIRVTRETLTLTETLTPTETEKPLRRVGKEPPHLKFTRFAIWRWQIEELMALLGPAASSEFGLDEWFPALARRADAERLVLPDPWPWIKAETVKEAQRRGFTIAKPEAQAEGNKRVAGLVAGGTAFLRGGA